MHLQPGRPSRAIGLGLFLCFVLVSLPVQLRHAWRRAAHAAVAAERGEGSAAAVRRIQGDAYVDALARILHAVPPGGAYFLVDGGAAGMGAAFWVRFDLAPRRALFLGRPGELTGAELAARLAAAPGLAVVIARGDRDPPLLLDRESFLRESGL